MAELQSKRESRGWVYCPICTHTVEARILILGRTARVQPGEKCGRCGSSLEAGSVLRGQAAA